MSKLAERFERLFGTLVRLSTGQRILVSIAAVIFAIGVGMVVILGAGYFASCGSPVLFILGAEFCYNPIEVSLVLFDGSFGGNFEIARTLRWTTLLLFTALSFAIPYKAGLFNIGAQGQFVLGSLGAAVGVIWAAAFVPDGMVGRLVLVPTGLLVGAAVGGLYGFLPGYLKVRFEMNEVVTTLLFNFIATAVAFVLVDRYFVDETIQGTQTEAIPDAAALDPQFFANSADFSLPVFVFALGIVAAVYWLLTRTTVGYELRAMGTQPKAAIFGGVSERFTTLFSMTTAGAIAGIGGALYVMMVLGRWQTGPPPLGFDGIAVSILAGNNPLGLFPSGLLFGALQSGGQAIQFQLGIPSELVEVLRGLIILLVATPELFRMMGKRLNRRGVIDIETGGSD
jgi:simple sugar transport system permease protein